MTVENDVRAVSAAMDAALISNDAHLVASFMTDDWVYVDATGATPKADIIGWIESGRLAHHSMAAVDAERVVRVGDVVLVTAPQGEFGHLGRRAVFGRLQRPHDRTWLAGE